MKLEESVDYPLIANVVKCSWDRESEDGDEVHMLHVEHEPGSIWLLCFEDDTVLGVILTEQENSSIIRIHPIFLKQHRHRGKEAMLLFFNWFLTIPERFIKCVASVPFCYKIVYNGAMKTGFTEEGINRQSYRKYGQVWDQWHLGMTRQEIQEQLC